MSQIKKKTSNGWVDVSIKKRTSNGWVDVDVYKRQDGKWVKLTSQQYTTTWESNWTQTYRQSGTKRTDYRGEKICQGEYLSDPWGIMRSLVGFPDMNSTLSGAKINDVKIYLKNEHWYYNAGGKAVIGYHDHSSRPTTFSHSKYGVKTQSYSSRGQALWIDMPNDFGEGLKDGRYEGFSIYANSSNMNYYGIFYGAKDGSNKPKIKITYTK